MPDAPAGPSLRYFERSQESGSYGTSLVVEREEDGRWIAEVPELAGVMVYGSTQSEAMARAEVLALRVLAERIEHSESGPQPVHITLPDAA